ncbi:hypothetical protein I302_104319 [Kwoniella bestiolae CBS 10118]|uniref:Zn(2)-C6 fungal-type domain-containing protein n=1 Tax=Kwoniella bestiolae CBS 10118 TaxID=1296100 RepID=A0A1B9GAX2_9TREE|nr:hypothetical protein I302_03027 [Kwoniella bestiolae CBS 10118]OCF28176.1 hypothetical protein I302_03027 [Kwoniella bestiolae CBS 10118]
MSFTPPTLPPISTLSAALENGSDPSMVIAPELMGEDGLPPNIKRRGSHSDHDAGDQSPHGINSNGYQSSSARDERSGWGNGSYSAGGNSRHPHPWEEGYRDDSHQQHDPEYSTSGLQDQDQPPTEGDKDGENEDGSKSDKPKPRKRARVSKPRQSKDNRNGVKDDGIPEDGVLDYADPSGDFKLGPVYIHPPKGAAQACVRCHKIKRKCDNAKPRCAGCNKADVACVFELSPATAGYVTNLKADNIALTSQIASAAERIQHLESAISNLERGLPPPPEREIFDDHQFPSQLTTQADFAAMSKTILSVRSSDLSSPVFGGDNHVTLDSLSSSNNQRSEATTRTAFGQTQQSPLPPYEVAQQAVESFFVMNAISYPFLDKHEFLKDMDDIYRQDQSGNRRGSTYNTSGQPQQSNEDAEHWAGKEFLLFMVIAIGTTNKERTGEVEKGFSKVYKDRAFASLQAAVGREDILCVQSLILLGIYAMFDPSGISLWHVVGFAARIAIALNLHRRVDDSTLPASVVEHRKRVFYSLFNLDRLVAVTLSKPLAIADNDIDVELPSPLPADEPYRGRPRIDFTRHITKLRRLGGVILSTVYSVSGEQNTLPEEGRSNIIHDLHKQLDTWLAECPLSPSDDDQPQDGDSGSMIHTSYSWFLLNYQQLLCLLHRPSPLFPSMNGEKLKVLHESSLNCVELYLNLYKSNKVSYNLINISNQFLSCISLLYCLCEFDSRDKTLLENAAWKEEVKKRLEQCNELLEIFSKSLKETSKYKEIFRKLSDLLLVRYGPLTESQPESAGVAPTPTTDIAPAQTDENTIAWNAMTQLWYNSGDFNFDGYTLGNALDGGAGNRDLGSARGLWDQLG